MSSGWRWTPFVVALSGLCMALVVLMYKAEQRHLTEVRDECVAAATTDAERAECLTDYEVNSGWF